MPVLLLLLAVLSGCASRHSYRDSRAALRPPLVFANQKNERLEITFLSPKVFRFSFLPQSGQAIPELIDTSKPLPAVDVQRTDRGFETSALKVTVNEQLCLSVFDKQAALTLTELCPTATHGLSLDAPLMTHAYGLGEEFTSASELSWVGKVRTPGHALGNMMQSFAGGAVGNAQFPILYALGPDRLGFALLYDNLFAQTWNFQARPWTASATGGPVRGYFIGGADLPELRRTFMALSGRPPLPPKKAFGLWVSEYGFDNWGELDGKLKSLQANHFPQDGFVLDLQWFGGVTENSEFSHMGRLQWDLKNFPEPKKKLAALAQQGIGIVAIEEPYVARKVADQVTGEVIYSVLAKKGFLVRNGPGPGAPPLDLPPAWLGSAAMLDYLDDEFADFWFDWKRRPLIEDGLLGHWTDLGEPDTPTKTGTFDKGHYTQAEVQNIFNRRWSESIVRGYQRHHLEQRPWILSRSGTIGSQAASVSMWSGDIGSNFESLQAHFRAQAHMSLSGIDYFGADIGGFHREALRGNMAELYTLWFANASFFDVPVRPHTFNLCNCQETSPDRIGDRKSNLANIRTRYSLLPYYYSLAERAYAAGDPLVAPLVYHFQEDLKLRDISDEKMIGPFLLAAAVAREGAQTRDVYLPSGHWYDFYTDEKLSSSGAWFKGRPLRRPWVHIPLFAREGSLLPMQEPGGDTSLRVYPSPSETSFTLYEDDGKTIAYTRGEARTTLLTQRLSGHSLQVDIAAAKGTFNGARSTRTWQIAIVTSRRPKAVSVNGVDLDRKHWSMKGQRLIFALADRPVEQPLRVSVELR